jgi:hypothetical protein
VTAGLVRYLAICAALAVCIAEPGLPALAVFLLVFAAVLLIPSGERER